MVYIRTNLLYFTTILFYLWNRMKIFENYLIYL